MGLSSSFSRWFASLTVVAGCLWLHCSGPGVGMGRIWSSSAPRLAWSRKSTKLMLPTTLFTHSPLAPTRGHCNLSWWRIVEVIRHFFLWSPPCFPLCHLDAPQSPIEFWHAFFEGTFEAIIYLQALNGSQVGFIVLWPRPFFQGMQQNGIEYPV